MHLDRPAELNGADGRLLRLAECAGRPAREVGRKAAVLGWADTQGLQTPGGLVLTSGAFWDALEAGNVAGQARYLAESAVRLDPQHTLDIAASLHAALGAPAVAAQARVIAETAFATVDAATIVCRSSAAMEDGKSASFPGVFVSILGLRSADALAAALVACWRSAFAPTAMRYLLRMGVEPIDVSLAALIQPQVAAAWYGLYVSADPLSGCAGGQVELTDAGPEALVHGASATLAARHRDGRWTSENPRLAEFIPAIDRISAAAAQFAAHLDAEVDIEFALPHGGAEPIILQARPLSRTPRTASAAIDASREGRVLRGRGCAAGRVSGRLAPLSETEPDASRIAVVKTLTPQDYAVVFDHAGVVMTDDTSPLGHVAILCRELGVPLVSGVPNATDLIGRWALIDGQTGEVQPIRAPERPQPPSPAAEDCRILTVTDLELWLQTLVEGRAGIDPKVEADRIARRAARRLGAKAIRQIAVPRLE